MTSVESCSVPSSSSPRLSPTRCSLVSLDARRRIDEWVADCAGRSYHPPVTPLNKTLLDLSQKSAAARANPLYPDSKSGSSSELYSQESRGLLPQEEAQARMILEKWIKAHTGRVVLAAAGWALALGGVMLAY